MAEKREVEVEQLKQNVEVQQALEQASGVPIATRPIEKRRVAWIAAYLLALLFFGGLHYMLRLGLLPIRSTPLLYRLTLAAMSTVLVFAAARTVDAFWIHRIADAATRYNLERIRKLLVGLGLVVIVVSVLYATWYTAAISLGLLSLVLGFALQSPISSFIGWIYLLVRRPYRVGDRIRMGEATGDVIEVGYLTTTLWEFGGEYLSTDHPSGRVIQFPNAKVLDEVVYNYSWPLFPWIWNEIKFQIAYDSDLEFVGKTMQQVVDDDLGPEMQERVRVYRELLANTPVDRLEVREHPSVQFRIADSTWIEAIVRYLVEPRSAGRVKTRLVRKLLTALLAEPDRVLFPKSNLR